MTMRRWLAALFSLWLIIALGCAGDDDEDDDDDATPADDDNDDDGTDDDLDDDTADDDADDDTADDDTADDDTAPPEYPHDGELRVNDLQSLGTHNSYHVQPDFVFHPTHRYTHQPLPVQLDIGVRQFELDLQWYPQQGLRVLHIPVVDPNSTCETLVDCLTAVKDWSDAHPGHQPLLFMLEPKDDLGAHLIQDHVLDVEADILSVWPRERILTPDDVRGDYATLREAIVTEGWPTLGETRNKIIFHAHSLDAFLTNYLAEYPNLEGALMFMDADIDDPIAAILPMNDAVGQSADITAAVQLGFLVRTMAGTCCDEPANNDYTAFDAGLASGANFISTDFPEPTDMYPDYWLEIPDGNPSRCNPIIAPEWCTPEDIENLP